MKFATAITCMDGRIQTIVNDYIQKHYNKEFVDTITLAGPVKVLAEGTKEKLINNLKFRLDISVNGHKSNIIALVGHHDCAGIKRTDDEQINFIKESVTQVTKWYPECTVFGLWIDEEFKPNKL